MTDLPFVSFFKLLEWTSLISCIAHLGAYVCVYRLNDAFRKFQCENSLSPSQSFKDDGRSKGDDRDKIQNAVTAIIGALSKRHNSTVMLAVVEVKVEKQVDSPPISESHDVDFRLAKADNSQASDNRTYSYV